jgi:hypothetical protein
LQGARLPERAVVGKCRRLRGRARKVGGEPVALIYRGQASPAKEPGSCLAIILLMSRSGTDSPYRPAPNRLPATPRTSQPPPTHRRHMTQQPVSRQGQSVSARLSVRRNLPRLLLHRSIRPRRHPMVAPVPILNQYRDTALSPKPGQAGGLNSLGNDRSDSHHCPRG